MHPYVTATTAAASNLTSKCSAHHTITQLIHNPICNWCCYQAALGCCAGRHKTCHCRSPAELVPVCKHSGCFQLDVTDDCLCYYHRCMPRCQWPALSQPHKRLVVWAATPARASIWHPQTLISTRLHDLSCCCQPCTARPAWLALLSVVTVACVLLPLLLPTWCRWRLPVILSWPAAPASVECLRLATPSSPAHACSIREQKGCMSTRLSQCTANSLLYLPSTVLQFSTGLLPDAGSVHGSGPIQALDMAHAGVGNPVPAVPLWRTKSATVTGCRAGAAAGMQT